MPKRLSRWRTLRLDALLVSVSMIWGSTFLIVQDTVKLVGPFTFLVLRFVIGAIVLALIFRKRLTHLTRFEFIPGIAIGIFLFVAYALQTIGLKYTTISKAGFITGLYVSFVPILSLILLRQRPKLAAILGVILSLTGLTLLSLTSKFNLEFGVGELLILGCALANAMHIVSISKFAPHADAMNLAIIQMTLTALLSFLAMPLAGEPFTLPPLSVWGSALFMGVVATAFCIAIMNWSQQLVSSTRATLIYALEPMWAGLFGYIVGESLSLLAWIGCGCIFLSMIVGKASFSFLKKEAVSSPPSQKELL